MNNFNFRQFMNRYYMPQTWASSISLLYVLIDTSSCFLHGDENAMYNIYV